MAYNRTLRKEVSRYFLSFEFVVYLQMKKIRIGFQGNLSLTGIKGYARFFSAKYLQQTTYRYSGPYCLHAA